LPRIVIGSEVFGFEDVLNIFISAQNVCVDVLIEINRVLLSEDFIDRIRICFKFGRKHIWFNRHISPSDIQPEANNNE
jgi:hypothetical protein